VLANFVLEMVTPGGGTVITLPGVAPAGRITWNAGFGGNSQVVFFVMDDLVQEEWGVAYFQAPNQLQLLQCIGNSAGTTAFLTFAGSARLYSFIPMSVLSPLMGGKVGRNLFHNPLFRVQQRGVGPFTTAGYHADRWRAGRGSGGGTISLTIGNILDGGRLAIGDEEAQSTVSYVFSGGSGAGDIDALIQPIESVRRLAGKTITVSFWANSPTVGGLLLGVNWSQVFGTGGSPSASVAGTAQVFNLTPTWTRYVATFVIPTAQGKTFGTTPSTDYTQILFYLSSGVTNNGNAGGISVQAGTANFWGMQCEIGPGPSPLEKPNLRHDVANCQRFYQIHTGVQIQGYNGAGGALYIDFALPVTMRIAPTVAFANVTNANSSATILNGSQTSHIRLQTTVTALGTANSAFDFTASADF
jgi:hypothetical protein